MQLDTDSVLNLPADDLIRLLETDSAQGLQQSAVEAKVQRYGKNVVETGDDDSLIMKFLE